MPHRKGVGTTQKYNTSLMLDILFFIFEITYCLMATLEKSQQNKPVGHCIGYEPQYQYQGNTQNNILNYRVKIILLMSDDLKTCYQNFGKMSKGFLWCVCVRVRARMCLACQHARVYLRSWVRACTC